MSRSNRRRERKSKNIFSKYVDSETVDAMVSGRLEADMQKPRRIGLLLLKIDYQDVEDLNRRYAAVIQRIADAGGIILELISNLLIAIDANDTHLDTAELSQQLVREHGTALAILHGNVFGVVSNLCSDRKLSYTILHKDLLAYLAGINDLAYGTIASIEEQIEDVTDVDRSGEPHQDG